MKFRQETFKRMTHCSILIDLPQCINDLHVFMHIFKEFKMSFSKNIFIFKHVEGLYFYFLMLKVIVFTFGCSKFLLLVLDDESFCSYFWILKVLTFIFRCWRILLLDVKGLWFLVFCLFTYSFKKWCESIFHFI
jgi:hypothetical protein